MFEKLFHLSDNKTTVRTELIAGLTTFMTMAYIIALNINLDMIGCIMGKFIGCVTGEEKLCHYISYMGSELGFGIEVSQDVYSSDSTPFADKGVPAVSFARLAPGNTATIHNSYDTYLSFYHGFLQKNIGDSPNKSGIFRFKIYKSVIFSPGASGAGIH